MLSEKTIRAFISQDEQKQAFQWPNFSLLHAAWAEDATPSIGLSGPTMKFLDDEIGELKRIDEKKKQEIAARTLKPPVFDPVDDEMKSSILSRYLLWKKFEFPTLNHEEVDGTIYMRATAMRALRGCPKEIQSYWDNIRWNFFRIYRYKNGPANPWLQFSLPGGFFLVSAKAIELAADESELAFLLVRALVREQSLEKHKIIFAKNWEANVAELAETEWANRLKIQNTKENKNIDVSDEIKTDQIAAECVSVAGYDPKSGFHYLKRLASKKDLPWAKDFFEYSIGLDYRVERFETLLEENVAKQKFEMGTVRNGKRFATAAKYWNILP